MKTVLLSADGELAVYKVPDIVAENLEQYCEAFCNKWLHVSPHAQKYRTDSGVVCYDESHFIEYLNTWIFPDEPSQLVETLQGVYHYELAAVPEQYRDCPWFNF